MIFVEFVDLYDSTPVVIRLDRILGFEVRSGDVCLLMVAPNDQSCYRLKGTIEHNFSVLKDAVQCELEQSR